MGPHPSCWDIVFPPGFGEERFAQELEHYLQAHSRNPRVAVRGADHTNSTILAFVHALHWKWVESQEPPKRLQKSAELYLDMLFSLFRESDRPLILILKRFHRVLDYLDEWVLGRLREEEQKKKLHTVIITPLPLPMLRKRWEAQNHYFSTSMYGDSRHVQTQVAPLPPGDIMKLCESLEIPGGVADVVAGLTGGFPEPLAAAVQWWQKQGRPNLIPAVQAQMRTVARDQLDVFVQWLDPMEDGRYRDHVIDLYHGIQSDEAREAFRDHPWKDVVLDEDGLRSEALGAACLKTALEKSSDRKTLYSPWYDRTDRSRRLYERRQYETALRVLESAPDHLKCHDKLLRAHCQIMGALCGNDGDLYFSEDTDCRRLGHVLKDARDVLTGGELEIGESQRQKIVGRYDRMERIAQAVAATTRVQGFFRNRVVDILAGFAGKEHCDRHSAALLLLTKYEAAKTIAGDTSACQFALSLPEQIFRVWALWKLQLNYYDAPAEAQETWQAASREWPSAHGALREVEPHTQFPSLFSFAFFAMALWHRLRTTQEIGAPETTFAALQSALSTYEAVRTGGAHGLYRTSKGERDAYFDLIERWLNSLLATFSSPTIREELLELIEPLPVVTARGEVVWQ